MSGLLDLIPNPRLVHLIINGTGADYSKISEALLDKNKVMVDGITIGEVTLRGNIVELDAKLVEKVGSEDQWKWTIYVGLSPRVQPVTNNHAPIEERDSVTQEVSVDLRIVRLYDNVRRSALGIGQ